uniref:Si:dkeyp-23e4.3 n=1 Tax=Oryzias melastigma TaxID=30732 RepID=A0A3B3CUS4_ORYME
MGEPRGRKMTAAMKPPLRRSFSENVKDSTTRAWDVVWRIVRERRLWEIEAREACDWLRAAGFPQYVQLFRDCRFPVDIEWVKRDHPFLDQDALDSLCRRLITLNKCSEMKLELMSEVLLDEEDFCTISPNWTYDRHARQWRRLGSSSNVSVLSGSPAHSLDESSCDVIDLQDVCSIRSSSSSESDGHDGRRLRLAGTTPVTISTPASGDTSRSSSRCSSAYKTASLDTSFSGPPSPSTASLEADGCLQEKPPRRTGTTLLRRMEKLRLRGAAGLLSPEQSCRPTVGARPVLIQDKFCRSSRMSQQQRRSSQQNLPPLPPSPGLEVLTVSQVVQLQKLALLKLTALMDKHSPSSRQGWSWTVPKPPSASRPGGLKVPRVFGAPLLLSLRQTGEALPPCISRALLYLRSDCLDQVGLFRKSGVKSRIQLLREQVESDPEGVSFEGQSAFDVADLVKQFFRDLPEPVFSSRLCESFLHIYQYVPQDQQLLATQAAVLLLPDENREALQTLLHFLWDVVSCVDQNQMTPTNIAVCLAPSLFHLTAKKDSRSGHRKHSLGRPDQRDLSENLAATQGLAFMITEVQRLFQVRVPTEQPRTGPPPPYEAFLCRSQSSGPVRVSRLLEELREENPVWENQPGPEPLDLAFRKGWGDAPLRLWRGSVEVDAPHRDVLRRLLREQPLWEPRLLQAAVIQTLSDHADIYRFLLRGRSPLPPQEHLLLRTWQDDPLCGPLYLSSASTEHPEIQPGGVRVHVHTCLYLLEPTGAIKTRLTHLCQTDFRGHSPAWDREVGGHCVASRLLAVRDSFRAEFKETKI